MKASGFSFIRNGNQLGYPFVPSIRSLLPLCDEIIVAAGWTYTSRNPLIRFRRDYFWEDIALLPNP